jgi:hypothetical protein
MYLFVSLPYLREESIKRTKHIIDRKLIYDRFVNTYNHEIAVYLFVTCTVE